MLCGHVIWDIVTAFPDDHASNHSCVHSILRSRIVISIVTCSFSHRCCSTRTQQKIDIVHRHYKSRWRPLVETLAGKLTSEPTFKLPVVAIPSFVPFHPSYELWTDYWTRFLTFLGANSIPDDKAAQIFLQSKIMYKLLGNLASQQTPPKT